MSNSIKSVSLRILGDKRSAQDALQWVSDESDKLAAKDPTVKIGADDDAAKGALSDLNVKLDKLAERSVTARASVDDAPAESTLDRLAVKLNLFGSKDVKAKAEVESKEASAELDKLDIKLLRLDKLVSNPRVSLNGIARARAEMSDLELRLDRLGHKRVTADVDVNVRGGKLGSIMHGLLGSFGGGGGGGDGGIGALGSAGGDAGGSGGIGGAAMPIGIGALAVLVSSLLPALVPLTLGGGIGAAGAVGGIAINTYLGKEIKAVATQIALAQKKGAPASMKADIPALNKELNQLNKVAEPFAGFQSAAQQAVLGLIKPIATMMPGLTALAGQFGRFLTSEGPEISALFKAALPSSKAFLLIIEQLAKAMLPAMITVLKELTPDLPELTRGFLILSQGLADFLKDLGPGMKDSAEVFVAMATGIKGILIAVAGVADFTASVLVRFGHNMRQDWEQASKDISAAWDTVVGALKGAWDWIGSHWTGQLSKMLHGPFDAASRLITRVMEDIGSAVQGVWHWIGQHWPDVAHFFEAPISSARTTIDGWMGDITGSVRAVYGWVRDHWPQVENFLDTPIGRARDFIDSVMGHIRTGWNDLTGFVRVEWDRLWSDIHTIVSRGEQDIAAIVDRIRAAFEGPFHFVEHDIWDPLAHIWNDIAGALHLPKLGTFAEGGPVGGTGNRDSQPALLTPGEHVIPVYGVQALGGHGAIAAMYGGQVMGSGSHYAAGGGVPSNGGGGRFGALDPGGNPNKGMNIFGDVGHFFEHIAGWTLAHIEGFAFGAINKLLPTGGNLVDQMLVGLVKALEHSFSSNAQSSAASQGPSGFGPVGHYAVNLTNIGRYMAANGYSRAAAAGIAGCIAGESGGNPESVGSGGNGLIGWTPPKPGIVTGRPQRDFNAQLPLILRYNEIWRQYIPLLNRQTDPVAAADIYSQYFERPAARDSDVRPDVARAVFAALGSAGGPKRKMAMGGIIGEPIRGVGVSGTTYAFGESGPERVMPGAAGGDVYYITVAGDTDPDGAARRIHQKLRRYKKNRGNMPLGIG